MYTSYEMISFKTPATNPHCKLCLFYFFYISLNRGGASTYSPLKLFNHGAWCFYIFSFKTFQKIYLVWNAQASLELLVEGVTE